MKKATVTENEKAGIKEWIKDYERERSEWLCPFTDCNSCIKLFPKIKIEGWCPCDLYGAAYVYRRAKEFLKR